MTLLERKYQLIEKITSTTNESVILKMEELLNTASSMPKEISDILEYSDNCSEEELIKHTSVKELLK